MNSVNIKPMLLIEEDLNGSNSLKILGLSHADNDSLILVKTIFTAKNAFGGTLTNTFILERLNT